MVKIWLRVVIATFFVIYLAGCAKQEKKTEETIFDSNQEEETKEEYQISSYGMGVKISNIIQICKRDEHIFLLGEQGNDTVLIQCEEDGSNAEKKLLDLEEDEIAHSIFVDKKNGLRILTSVNKKEKIRYYLKTIEEEKVIEYHELKQKKNKEKSCSANSSIITNDGLVYMIAGSKNQEVVLFDSDGKEINRIDCQTFIDSLVQTKNGDVYAYGGNELKKLDIEKGTVSEKLSLEEIYTLNAIVHSGENNTIYFSDSNNFYSFDILSNTVVNLFRWVDKGMDGSNIRDYLPMEDGSFFAVSVPAGEKNREVSAVIINNQKDSEETETTKETEKKVLRLACVNINNGFMRDNILEFNQTNENYQIQVEDYGSDSLEAFIQLNLDITSGNIPDIICLDMLPANMYAEKGLLTDLYPLIEEDKEIHADDFIDSVRNAAEKNGKLYYMGATFQFDDCLTIEKKYLESDEGWSMEDMEKLYQKMPDDGVFLNDMTKQKFITKIVLSQIEDYVDTKTGKVHFESEEFIKLLAFSDHFQDEIQINNNEIEIAYQEIAEGKLMAYDTDFFKLVDISMLKSMYQRAGGTYQVISYPSKEKTNHLSISFCDPAMAISEQCEDKEGAWEFLRQFFTYDYEIKASQTWYLPTRKDALEKRLEYAMATEAYTDKDGTVVSPLEGSMNYMNKYDVEYHPLEEEDISFVRSLIDRIEKIRMDADDMQLEILDIVITEAEGYFSGDKTAEETAEIIQNRVQLYVNENL